MSVDQKKTILLIDDSYSIRAYIRQILEKENYNVVEAENGEIGLKLYREGKFDLILTDIYMPVINGLELVVRIKKEFPDTKVIIISDGGKDHFSDDLEVCESLGASSFLSKSKINEELLPLINKTLLDS